MDRENERKQKKLMRMMNENETINLPPTVLFSSNGHNGQVWARSKLGAKHFIRPSLEASGALALRALSAAFSGTLAGS